LAYGLGEDGKTQLTAKGVVVIVGVGNEEYCAQTPIKYVTISDDLDYR